MRPFPTRRRSQRPPQLWSKNSHLSRCAARDHVTQKEGCTTKDLPETDLCRCRSAHGGKPLSDFFSDKPSKDLCEKHTGRKVLQRNELASEKSPASAAATTPPENKSQRAAAVGVAIDGRTFQFAASQVAWFHLAQHEGAAKVGRAITEAPLVIEPAASQMVMYAIGWHRPFQSGAAWHVRDRAWKWLPCGAASAAAPVQGVLLAPTCESGWEDITPV